MSRAPSKGRKKSKWEQQRGTRRARRFVIPSVAAALLAAAAIVLTGVLGPSSSGLNTSLHQHPALEIYVDGVSFANGPKYEVPVNIGIDPALWKDHSLDQIGSMKGMSAIHTHESGGKIHLEMTVWHPCTLGDFFSVWGQYFDRDGVLDYRGPVTVTVDGVPSQQYRDLILQDLQVVVVQVSP